MDTPVPIPNTEVKHSDGENSWTRSCKHSSLPGFIADLLVGFFYWIQKNTYIRYKIKSIQDLFIQDDFEYFFYGCEKSYLFTVYSPVVVLVTVPVSNHIIFIVFSYKKRIGASNYDEIVSLST